MYHVAAVDPGATDITPISLHPVLWVTAAGVFIVIILQSVIYFRAIRAAAPAVNLTPKQVSGSVRRGAIAAIGPSLAVTQEEFQILKQRALAAGPATAPVPGT